MDELPPEFQHLRQDYDGLQYPGDLPDDLGLIPARPIQRSGWRIGPTAGRWIGMTAAAAAVVLVVGGVWHAVTTSPSPSQSPIASLPPTTQRVPEAVAVRPPVTKELPAPMPTPVPTSPAIEPETAIASAKTTASPKSTDKTAAAVDDSIPLWSEVEVSSTSLSVSAGLPSQSLILPTLSEIQAEKAETERAKAASSKS